MISALTIFAFASTFNLVRGNSVWTLGEKKIPHDAYQLRNFRSKVEAENSVVFQLTSGGSLELLLNSESGDADIYVSSRTKNPSADDYEMSSATCASDVVRISEDQPRPVHIAIFGSPYHPVSTFTLDVYHVPAKSSYDRIFAGYNAVSYDQLVAEHVVLPDSREPESDWARGARSQAKRESVSADGDEGWFSWLVEGEEGWSALASGAMTVIKVILQILA